MKLDLNATWDQGVRLIGMNREVVLIVSGVFFFLPYVLFQLSLPLPDLAAAAGPAGADTSAMMAALNGFIAQYWWALLLYFAVQTTGALAVMAILGDPRRPTVQDAIARGGALLPSSLMTSLLAMLASLFVIVLATLLGAVVGSEVLTKTLALAAGPVAFWLWSALSLSIPAIAIEKIANPVASLRRSWQLTRGSRLRLAVFYVLLLVAFLVIFEVLGLATGLFTALFSAETAAVVSAIAMGVMQAVFSLLIFAVQASAHRLLARAERTLESDSGAPDPA